GFFRYAYSAKISITQRWHFQVQLSLSTKNKHNHPIPWSNRGLLNVPVPASDLCKRCSSSRYGTESSEWQRTPFPNELAAPNSFGKKPCRYNNLRWLGREDSNLRMAESKSDQFAFSFNGHSEK